MTPARILSVLLMLLLSAALPACTTTGGADTVSTETAQAAPEAPAPALPPPEPPKPPRPIGLAHWVEADYSRPGPITVEDGTIYLGKGNDMTGIVWTGPLVRMNYEITLDAKRVEGDDFFCGLTFPVGDTVCSLILGGWGGTVVGLSSLEYQDAVDNETASYKEFEQDRWYAIWLRVTPEKIEAWIDDDKVVDFETAGRRIGIRWEMEDCRPLGIATWRTTGAMRDFHITPIDTVAE